MFLVVCRGKIKLHIIKRLEAYAANYVNISI